MRTTVSIDERLLAAAKDAARGAGQTLGEFVEESLRLKLASKQGGIAPTLPTFTRGTGLRPGVDPSSNRSLYDALDDAGDLT